ncbi:MAG TPA: GNAT family N-acetyltransferase [Firmicutes bacterium]|nr:GNAT family N-acetyltransferase [Bacillota bacterium]
MFRPIGRQDRDTLVCLMREFYHSPAVLHPVPDAHFQKTADLILAGTPYADAYLFEEDGQTAGYALTAKTYSNEAGGLVLWLEEVYIRPAFQGRGIGGRFLRYLAEEYPEPIARLRLEVEEANEGAARLYRRAGYRDFPYRQMIWDGSET